MMSNRLLSQPEVMTESKPESSSEGPLPGTRAYYFQEAKKLGIKGISRIPKAELVDKVNKANQEHGGRRTVAKRNKPEETPERGVASSGPRVSRLPAEASPLVPGEADDFDAQLAELSDIFAQLEAGDQPQQMAPAPMPVAPYAPQNRLLAGR